MVNHNKKTIIYNLYIFQNKYKTNFDLRKSIEKSLQSEN